MSPVFAAMEIATLARLYPGRFLPGFGHGVAGWMRQIGAFPASQLTALEEVTVTTCKLLRGETVSFQGQHVQLDQATLVHPPDHIPPIYLGVIGPKSLALSGRVADGTILSEFSSPAYVTWAREEIDKGQAAAGHARDHRLTVFSFACADAPSVDSRQKLRPLIAAALASNDGVQPKIAALDIEAEIDFYLAKGGEANLAAGMPETWINQMTLGGSPTDWRGALERLSEVGAAAVILVPLPDSDPDEIDILSRQLLAALD